MQGRDRFSALKPSIKNSSEQSELRVLIINSCQKMAKEITHELMQTFTGASLTYAPTFSLAKLMLSRRPFDLVVSSSRMPDGKVQSLKEVLNSTKNPPTLVIIGDSRSPGQEMLGVSGYLFSALRPLSNHQPQDRPLADPIKELGADLRNDLNNPLQEIVAMAYVAKSQNAPSEVTNQALEAITRAAGNLSSVVRNIEQKIRLAVAS